MSASPPALEYRILFRRTKLSAEPFAAPQFTLVVGATGMNEALSIAGQHGGMSDGRFEALQVTGPDGQKVAIPPRSCQMD